MKKFSTFILCVLTVLMISGCMNSQPLVDELFSCYTEDQNGHQIKGFYSEKDQQWFLFLTSVQNMEEVVVNLEGKIKKASNGSLDTKNNTLTHAFKKSGDQVVLTTQNGNEIIISAYQSQLPSVYIDLNETTLDEIHVDKNNKFEGNSVYIYDLDEEFDLCVENTVQIKGRGNSTWRNYEKKAYQIKFEEKTSVMGMEKAKKWVLMANASDDSMIRTKLVYDTAEKMDFDFVTEMKYVDLWIEGDYRGTFMIGEKVEPGNGRLELSHEAGALFEDDQAFFEEEDYWFVNEELNRIFTMKEINEEEYAYEAIDDFNNSLGAFVRYLYSTPSNEVTVDDLSRMIDVDSFVKYYVINEFVLNQESFLTCFYWYKDGPADVIHLGPIWDYDTCMGNDGVDASEILGTKQIIFRYLLACEEFHQLTEDAYQQYQSLLFSMDNLAKKLTEDISTSAIMNYYRWNVLGKVNPKGGLDFGNSFSEASDTLYQWLNNREISFVLADSSVVTSVVSPEQKILSLYFCDENDYETMDIAVWSQINGQDDLIWYQAEKKEDGSWVLDVDLRQHKGEGLYHIAAYPDGRTSNEFTGLCYVE
ncbi:MAG: CotH kinase family protein [Erysipelotrichaceae bacterium]|nr:CotH kinase family protein [Erysipelotrichaceae bacterium]